jgi:hypothetical protein
MVLTGAVECGGAGLPASRVGPEGGIIVSDTSSSTAMIAIRSDETMLERLAVVGFLAGYAGPTRDS